MLTPLRQPVFRRLWLASVLSNMGQLIGGVGAAWTMTQLTPAADLVALVQTAQFFPLMLFALPAGAIADMYDRRIVILVALTLAFTGALSLAVFAALGMLSPWLLLWLCFLIGSGISFFWASWQASVREQVSITMLPAAVALNSISYNIARSLGPAAGGIIVAVAGPVASFSVNTLFFLPLIFAFYRWNRTHDNSRPPPERLAGTIVSGMRYVANSPSIRGVLIRTLVTGLAGGALTGLLPLVARDLLGGDASTFGFLLGAFGVGAIVGALSMNRVRAILSPETTARVSIMLMAAATAVVAVSGSQTMTMAALLTAGMVWLPAVTTFNVSIQFAAPRWVAGRTLAAFQAAIAGGLGLGSWFWGILARSHNVDSALIASAVVLALSTLLGLWLPVPAAERPAEDDT